MNPLTALGIALIRAYQLCISPWLGANCRFEPSCSAYGIAALRGHGLLRGSWLTIRRLLRCHPFAQSGHDPVPPVSCSCHPHGHPQ